MCLYCYRRNDLDLYIINGFNLCFAVDIGSQVAKFIKCDPELYMKILLYEPIFVEDLQASLKANGIKTNMNNLLEILDEQVRRLKKN